MDTRTSPIRLRIDRLREVMASEGVHALLVPSSDPHLSEYLPGRWQGREWFSGFTGSMGTLVVTVDEAVLFADSRYWVQAEAELAGTGITLEKIPTGNAMAHIDWLARRTPAGSSVAVDGQVLGLAAAQALRAALDKARVVLRTDVDLLDRVWPERPALPSEPVYEHLAPHAPTPRAAKLAAVRQGMARHGASHHFVSTVDDIAWITNLRGSDVDYNPVFLAHLLVDAQAATLYVGDGKVDAGLRATLAADGVRLAPYAQAPQALAALPAGSVLLVDPKRVTHGLRQAVAAGVQVVEAINPSTLAKSRKTAEEATHVREAMADRVQARLETVMPGLAAKIIGRRSVSPADLEALNMNLVGGDPYSGVCSPDQFFFMRPFAGHKNARSGTTPWRNLHQIGASVHPGPGLGGQSGYLAAQRILKG